MKKQNKEKNKSSLKTKVLYIENGLGFGGAVTCLAALLRQIDRKKYRTLVLSSHNDIETQKIIKRAGTKFFYVRKYKRPLLINNLIEKSTKIGATLKNCMLLIILVIETICKIPSLIRILVITKKSGVDIIHLNNNISCNIEGLIIAKLLKIPCISHLRGPEYNSFEARFFSQYISRFIPMSNFIKESVIKLGVCSSKIKVVYDGIEINTHKKISNVKNNEVNKYNIGLFGCLVDWKGHEVFIKAIDILLKEMNLKDYKFFIVGDVPDKSSKLKENLIDLVTKLELSNHVVFIGYQDNVYPLMEKMDVIVHTSIKPEPFGRVIIEAMSIGKPVIATKMGGPLEIIQDGFNGILIPPDKPYILANAISNLLKNKDLLTKISHEAKKTIEQKFTMENSIREIEKIYQEVAKCD